MATPSGTESFCAKLKSGLPEGTGVALRGSVVTNKRWEDGKPLTLTARKQRSGCDVDRGKSDGILE